MRRGGADGWRAAPDARGAIIKMSKNRLIILGPRMGDKHDTKKRDQRTAIAAKF